MGLWDIHNPSKKPKNKGKKGILEVPVEYSSAILTVLNALLLLVHRHVLSQYPVSALNKVSLVAVASCAVTAFILVHPCCYPFQESSPWSYRPPF